MEWTDRANEALQARSEPLIIEMSLYFSCVLKKRVLFHEHSESGATEVNGSLKVLFQAVQSAVCDPEELAKDFPVGKVLDSSVAIRMIPSKLRVDFRQGRWLGEFGYEP